jgi:prophage antirepressor-like protein
MSDLTPYDFEGATVRVASRGGGLWFVSTDVCGVLGLHHAGSAMRILDADEKGVHKTHTLGGMQELSIISEPGFYKLVGRSRKPEARRFDRWVRHEVLPSLRRTGAYGPASQPIDLTDSNFVLKLLEAQATKALAEGKRADAAEQRVAVLAPRAAALDELAASSGSASISEAAKLLNVKQGRFFSYLEEKQWIFRRLDSDGTPGRWLARAEPLDRKWLEHAATSYLNRYGDRVMDRQVRVTAAGIARLSFIFEKFGRP